MFEAQVLIMLVLQVNLGLTRMRLIKITVLLFLLVLLLLFFFKQLPDEDTKQNTTLKQTAKITFTQPTNQSKLSELDDRRRETFQLYKDNWQRGLANYKPKPLKTDPSYIEAYRDYDYARSHCKDIITSLAIGAEPYGFELRDYQDRMTEQQSSVFQNRVSKCQDLGQPTWRQDITMDIGLVITRLKSRMDQVGPKTAEEMVLQNILKQIEATEKIGQQLFNLERGEVIDFELRSKLYLQKKDLQSQYPRKNNIFSPYDEADMPLVKSLDQQVAKIEAQMRANTFFDHDMIENSQKALAEAIAHLNLSMNSTTSGDGFWAIHSWFKEKHSDDQYDFYLKHIKQAVGIKKLDDWIQPILMKFRACELGKPCDANSSMAESMCLEFNNPQSSNACEIGVIEFYLDKHLSEHQLMDVEHVLLTRFVL